MTSDASSPVIDPYGFREYDARWRFGSGIGLPGLAIVGRAMGTLMRRRGVAPAIIVGHDFRSYSKAVKDAVVEGLVAAGCHVADVGLALTPMAYFARIDRAVGAVAMITASHNPNGWTGLKLGLSPGTTLLPDDMAELRGITLKGQWQEQPGGRIEAVGDMSARYAASFAGLLRPQRKLRIVVACGNGTAGLFAPSILAAAGITVIPLDCQLDADFPNCDPNPEDVLMLGRLGEAVRTSGADAGLAFDGDGDRCGFADETGRAISADRVGLLLARGMALRHPGSHFLADVKSTGLFARDPVLRESGATVEYWKTGHSYMRQRLLETRALAAFEKSGHFFFNHPEGLGYDDAIATGLAFCRLLGNGASVSQLDASLGTGFVTPTMSPHCPDHCKYQVVDAVTRHYQDRRMSGATMAGHAIIAINRLSGARIELADGSWGLVRASSNKPELTVVCESPVSEAMMHTVFADIDAHLASYPDVGPYNQKIAKPHKS